MTHHKVQNNLLSYLTVPNLVFLAGNSKLLKSEYLKILCYHN